MKSLFISKAILVILFFLSGCFSLSFEEFARQRAIPFKDVYDVDVLVSNIPEVKLVLLGESTHGTLEYYRMRAEISKRLIKERGFNFIVVEGDWASLYKLNQYIKRLDESLGTAEQIMKGFNRWPEWMWANREVLELIEWLREYNDGLDLGNKIGFYGMDVYGQWDAMEYLLRYAEENLPEYYQKIYKKASTFTAYNRDEWLYAKSVIAGHPSAEESLEAIVEILLENSEYLKNKDEYEFFNVLQSAMVLKKAEDFYRTAVVGGNKSWNSRVHHMNDTVNRLLDLYGKESRGIVWAHNTHIGDSRATSMKWSGSVNIGKLSRTQKGRDNVFSIGFVTYTGSVLAGTNWGSQVNRMIVPTAIEGSIENELNKIGITNYCLIFEKKDRQDESLMKMISNRAIGVVYNPNNEFGNYVPTIIPDRYDVLVFFTNTKALEELNE